MDGTRMRIVELLQSDDGQTVDALMAVLDLAAATVRRHLDVLQRDGYVEREAVRRSTGRPHYVFKLTQAGRELTPGRYATVADLLMSQLLSLSETDTLGKDGAGIVLLAFERMNEALLRSCESRISASSPAERMHQAVEALASGGLILETAPRRGGFQIKVRDCPCRCAASAQDAVCRRSHVMLSQLLGGRLGREEGVGPCSYFLRTQGASRAVRP